MVTQYGMSEKMGPMVFGQRHEMIFLGREIGEQRNYGERVAREIDGEVNRIVTAAYNRAKGILTKYSDLHQAIARKLIEVETLDAGAFEAFFVNVPGIPPRQVELAPAPTTTPSGSDEGIAAPDSNLPTRSPTPRPAPA